LFPIEIAATPRRERYACNVNGYSQAVFLRLRAGAFPKVSESKTNIHRRVTGM
jgi:hypothetical protein